MIKAFLNYLRSRGYSEDTIKTYIDALRRWANFLKERHIKTVNQNTVEQFVEWLSLKYSGRTINTTLSALSSYYQYLIVKGKAKFNYFNLKPYRAKVNKTIPHEIPDEIIDKIFKEAPFWLIPYLELMLYAGLRVSEVCSVPEKVKIEETDGYINVYVTGKGNKERKIPVLLDDEVMKKRWLEFKSTHTTGTVKAAIFRLSKKIGYHFSAHDLRKKFAFNALKSGTPLEILQNWLGHEDPATTMIYARITEQGGHYAKTGV